MLFQLAELGQSLFDQCNDLAVRNAPCLYVARFGELIGHRAYDLLVVKYQSLATYGIKRGREIDRPWLSPTRPPKTSAEIQQEADTEVPRL